LTSYEHALSRTNNILFSCVAKGSDFFSSRQAGRQMEVDTCKEKKKIRMKKMSKPSYLLA
jgi:hypothetical protein